MTEFVSESKALRFAHALSLGLEAGWLGTAEGAAATALVFDLDGYDATLARLAGAFGAAPSLDPQTNRDPDSPPA